EALCEWSDWSQGRAKSSAMYRESDTLSDSQKTELQKRIRTIRQLITRVRDDLILAPKNVATSQSIAGHASLLCEMLTELNSRELRGYGTVPDQLARYLDPIGEKLTEQMNEIAGLISKPTRAIT